MSDATKTQSDLFQDALSLQQKNQPNEALLIYHQLLKSEATTTLTKDQAATVHHNLSIIYLSQNESALSQVHNYVARNLDPSNKNSLEFRSKHEQFKNSIVQPQKNWSNSDVFKFLNTDVLFIILLLVLALFTKKIFQYYKIKKSAEIENLDTPSVPWSIYCISALMFALVCLMGIKFYDQSLTRTVVIAENANVLASPGENQALITSVSRGVELLVLRTQDVNEKKYIQVRSTGQYSGWVGEESLILSNQIIWPSSN